MFLISSKDTVLLGFGITQPFAVNDEELNSLITRKECCGNAGILTSRSKMDCGNDFEIEDYKRGFGGLWRGK